MHWYTLLLLTLLPLALSQTIQTTVSCLSDGQCITDRGEDAVCGKLDASSSAQLAVVEGTGEEYTIRIDLSAPLSDDPNADPELQCTGKDCPANASAPNCEKVKGECRNEEEVVLLLSANDPRNPTLGGVGCETPAFRKACQKCCVQTDILSRISFRNARETRDSGEGVCEIDGKCEGENADDEALRFASTRSRQDCFRAAPLGFYRTPRQRFFQRCTQLSRTICGAGLRSCRNFSA